jgi:hypothetical protein
VSSNVSDAGDLLEPGGEIKDRIASAGKAGLFYSKWLPQLAGRQGAGAELLRRARPARAAHALRRAILAQAGSLDVL